MEAVGAAVPEMRRGPCFNYFKAGLIGWVGIVLDGGGQMKRVEGLND